MKSRALLIVASVAALSACNRGATNNTAAAPAATTNSTAAAPATPAAPAAAPAGNVPAQLQAAAQAIQSQAPIQQGPVAITGATVEGSTLITAMTMPVALDDNTISMMETQLAQQLCANPQFVPLSKAGASFAYDITDGEGETHRVNVPACP